MENKNKVAETQGAETTTQETGLQTVNENLVSIDHEKIQELQGLFKMFEQKETNEMASLTSEYLKMEENKSYSFIFVGMSTFTTDQGEERECARLISKENQSFISGAAVLVSACKKITKIPKFIKIITGGKTKTANGSYISMEVKSL
jgi:hypothetical protein